MKHLAFAAIAVFCLAACGESRPATDGDTAASTPAVSAAAATPPEMEGPAAGKWRVTMISGGMTLPPTETCYARHTTLAEVEKMKEQAGVSCSEQTYRRDGDAIVSHSVCVMSAAGKQVKTTTDMTVTGDFNTAYTMDVTNVMDPPPAPGLTEQKIIMVAERIGNC